MTQPMPYNQKQTELETLQQLHDEAETEHDPVIKEAWQNYIKARMKLVEERSK
jgi:hypothetical protein